MTDKQTEENAAVGGRIVARETKGEIKFEDGLEREHKVTMQPGSRHRPLCIYRIRAAIGEPGESDASVRQSGGC